MVQIAILTTFLNCVIFRLADIINGSNIYHSFIYFSLLILIYSAHNLLDNSVQCTLLHFNRENCDSRGKKFYDTPLDISFCIVGNIELTEQRGMWGMSNVNRAISV